MKFSHYSASPELTPISMKQSGTMHEPRMKPKGLRLSVDGPDDWAAWCRDEEFALDRLEHRFEVTLRPGALVLSTPAEVAAFSEEYTLAPGPIPGSPFIHYLDWPRVAAEHPGIIIAPYQWSLRLDPKFMWYYGWDCASGCIWDADLIKSVERHD